MSVSSTTLIHERECFIRMARGDEAAFAEIFYHYNPRIYPFVKKMVRSIEAAEEIIQDVFVSLWKNREGLIEIQNHTSYIFTIATNKTYNHLKYQAREHRIRQALLESSEDVTNNTTEAIDLNQIQGLINKLVNQLSPQKKLIYQLTRDEGLSHEEIARRLNISKNTVKNHLVETLKFLRSHLKESQDATFSLIILVINANL